MTTLPPWLAETRDEIARIHDNEYDPRAIEAFEVCYAILKAEMDLLVEVLLSMQTEINKAPSMVNEDSIAIVCNDILTRHKEKFPRNALEELEELTTAGQSLNGESYGVDEAEVLKIINSALAPESSK